MYPSRNIKFNANGDMVQDNWKYGITDDVIAAILMTLVTALFATIIQV